MENPNYFAILTADVRYSEKINANEKLLFAEITALSNSTGICWASNNYFANLYYCTPQAISKWIKNLEKNNFISIKYLYKKGSKEIEKREISCVNLGINNHIKGINNDLGGYQHTIKDNNTSINNIKFKELNDIIEWSEFVANSNLNENYLKICRRFWKLWMLENPNNKTLNDAKILNWYNSIRLIIEVDKQNIERLICIYKYFQKCQQNDSSFKRFWFEEIMSLPAMRKTNKDGVYRLDMIMKDVNDKIQKDDSFNRLVTDSIDKFKNYNHERN